MGALAFLTLLSLPLLVIFNVKRNGQKMKDQERKTYRLTFPTDLDEERIAAWVRSISGTLRSSPFGAKPSVSFELLATQQGITHRMKVPWQQADYIISQLRSLVPGIRVEPEEGYRGRDWTRSVEVGLTKSGRQLRIFNAADTAHSILTSLHPLEPDEAVLIQWVVSPAAPRHLPVANEAKTDSFNQLFKGKQKANRDEVNDRREKLSDVNVLAVLRVASKANTETRADHLIYRVRSSMASFHSPATKFYKRMASKNTIQNRIDNSSASMVYPIQLSASEITALIAWPIGDPPIPGLPRAASRHHDVTEVIPRTGRVIGHSNMPGRERPVAIRYLEARMHTHVCGATGSGKTSLLANMLKQDIEQGYGVVLIETKGDLFHTALDYIPPHRVNDVIVMDVNDISKPVGFNILDQGNSKVVIDEITNLFEYLYQTNSVWTKEVLYHGLRTLASDPKMTFVDIAPLLVPMTTDDLEWRDGLIRSLTDKELKNFWQRFDNQPRAAQDRITQPVMDRVWQLNARPEIRNIIGQSSSSFQMRDVIANGKILLVNLSGLSGDTASLTGTLLMNALWNAVKGSDGTKTNFLYLDEFQSFLRLPVDPEDMLAKARSFGLGMFLAHQHLGQLPNDLRNAVMANARSKIVFQTSNTDAKAFSNEFGNSVSEADFMHLGKYEAISRIATGDGVSKPFSLATNEPSRGYGKSSSVRESSRSMFGRNVSDIEQEMTSRRTAKPVEKKKPRQKGWDAWDM